MSQDPVSQARENLDTWMAVSRRAGESVHWRQLNRHIASLSNLTQFRRVNAENAMKEEGRLGLDSARLDQESETQLVLDRLLSHWSFTEVAGLLESRVGSPPQFDVRTTDGQSLKTDVHDLHMVNFALTFCRFLSSNRTTTPAVLEIGGGYGATVAKIATLLPSVRFVLVDLPPACWLQSYYLNELFPGQVRVLPLNSHLEPSDMTHRFTICEPDTFFNGAIRISGAINARSFGEMDKPVVRRYFDYIHTNMEVGGIFMNVNRLVKLGFRYVDYPYDNKWKVLQSRPAFNQESNHWELVTQRLAATDEAFGSWKVEVPKLARQSIFRRLYLRLADLRRR